MRFRILGLWLFSTLLFASAVSAANTGDLVAQVSESNLIAHVAALEFDRSSPASQALAADYIKQELAAYGYTVTTQPVSGSENIIATRVGTSLPDQEFVLGAHFDTVSGSPGADDNASSVAAVLEVARILANESLDTTVHFVFFALEEFGYQGSEALAASFASENRNVIGMISLDMIGYTCSTPGCQAVVPPFGGCFEVFGMGDVGDFIGIGSNVNSEFMLLAFLDNAALFEPTLPIAGFVVAGTGTCFPDSRRSDHKSFWDEGYPAIILGDGAEARNPNYHQSTDTLATLDTAFMTSVTRAVLAHVTRTARSASLPSLSAAGFAGLALMLLAAGRRAMRSRG